MRYLLLLTSLLIISCAPTEPAIPPGVDIFKVEATANEALKKADSAQVAAAAILENLDFISGRINLLDSISSALPLATIGENQLQIALLREEVAFIRRFLENQDKVPLINPTRKQPAEALGPFPKEYDQAQYLFSQKKYQEASEQFEKVTILYPKSDWADDAWYWAGESQMALGNYGQAISAFEKVFFYVESVKQDDARFQIGICLLKMGNRELAKEAFYKVKELHPRSPRALQAQSELNKLK